MRINILLRKILWVYLLNIYLCYDFTRHREKKPKWLPLWGVTMSGLWRFSSPGFEAEISLEKGHRGTTDPRFNPWPRHKVRERLMRASLRGRGNAWVRLKKHTANRDYCNNGWLCSHVSVGYLIFAFADPPLLLAACGCQCLIPACCCCACRTNSNVHPPHRASCGILIAQTFLAAPASRLFGTTSGDLPRKSPPKSPKK